MKAGWWDTPLALQNLAEAISIISDNELPHLTRNNFQTPHPPTFYLDLTHSPPPPALPPFTDI